MPGDGRYGSARTAGDLACGCAVGAASGTAICVPAAARTGAQNVSCSWTAGHGNVLLRDADPDAARITEILDAIPGAWERTQEGLAQAARGEGTPLDELT